MAAVIDLKINDVSLKLTNDSYKTTFSSVDNKATTEAGTTLRAVTRTGIKKMSISYKCDQVEKILLESYQALSYLTCKYYDETTSSMKSWRCYMDGYSEDLITESVGDKTRFYKVSFTLNDLEN